MCSDRQGDSLVCVTCFTYIWPKLLCSAGNIWRFIEPESKREHNSALMGRGGDKCAFAKNCFQCFICRVARGLSRLVFLRCTGAEHEVPESSYAESRTEWQWVSFSTSMPKFCVIPILLIWPRISVFSLSLLNCFYSCLSDASSGNLHVQLACFMP